MDLQKKILERTLGFPMAPRSFAKAANEILNFQQHRVSLAMSLAKSCPTIAHECRVLRTLASFPFDAKQAVLVKHTLDILDSQSWDL